MRRLPPFFEHKSRLVYSKMEAVNSFSELEHPAARNCLKFLGVEEGLEIHYDGDLPARSGVGSSSSFTVGMLHAIHCLKGEMISKLDLAKEAIHVEQVMAKECVGIQDQILTSVGGLNSIEMGLGNTFEVSPLILDEPYKNYLEKCIMLGFSGVTRFASKVAAQQIQNIENGSIQSQLSEMVSIAKEGHGHLIKSAEISSLGKLLHKTWMLKKSLTSSISSNFLDAIYERALLLGAFGGRLLGAGGGGFMFFLAPPERQEAIREGLKNEIKVWIPFKFENKGTHVLVYEQEKAENNIGKKFYGKRNHSFIGS